MHRVAVRLFAPVELNKRRIVQGEPRVTRGLGVWAVRVGGCRVVRVPRDDTDCASRGRPFGCVDLNLRRLVRWESKCY